MPNWGQNTVLGKRQWHRTGAPLRVPPRTTGSTPRARYPCPSFITLEQIPLKRRIVALDLFLWTIT